MGTLRLPPALGILIVGPVAALLTAATAIAQEPTEVFDAPAHLAYVDGSATLDRDGQGYTATSGMPLVAGDRVRTTAGRVEVLFPDGSALDADEYTTLELLSPTLLRVTAGRVLLTVTGSSDPAGAIRYQIDTPAASAFSDGPGEYRVAIYSRTAGTETELAVLRGYAAFSTDFGSVAIGAGERSLAWDNAAPSAPQRFNSARFDAFERWAAARRDERTGTLSAQYLPRDLHAYSGAFDRYGAWSHEPDYGYVWYPTVAPDWRPYYHGYWSPIRTYGWTWIGFDPWGWPTHHYGRWGYSRSRWFWIPARRWAPAWVSWASAPGYVSWCPLGFNNRPVFALSISIGNPWHGWTVFPRQHFGVHGYYVNRYAVQPRQVVQIVNTTQFVVQPTAPVPAPRAVPRYPQRAVPRDGRTIVGQQADVNGRAGVAGSAVAGAAVARQRSVPFASPRSAVISRQRAESQSGAATGSTGRGGQASAIRRPGIAAAVPSSPPTTQGGTARSSPLLRAPSASQRSAGPPNGSAQGAATSDGAAGANANATPRARPRSNPSLTAPLPLPRAGSPAPAAPTTPNDSTAGTRTMPRSRVAPMRVPPASSASQPPSANAPSQWARPSRQAPQAVPRTNVPPAYTAPAPPTTAPPSSPQAVPAPAPPRYMRGTPPSRVAPDPAPRGFTPPSAAPAPQRGPAAVPRGAGRSASAPPPSSRPSAAAPPSGGGSGESGSQGGGGHSPRSRRPR